MMSGAIVLEDERTWCERELTPHHLAEVGFFPYCASLRISLRECVCAFMPRNYVITRAEASARAEAVEFESRFSLRIATGSR